MWTKKQIIMRIMKDTDLMDQCDTSLHEFKLHDFEFQGTSSVESALWRFSSRVDFLGTEHIVLNYPHDFKFQGISSMEFEAIGGAAQMVNFLH